MSEPPGVNAISPAGNLYAMRRDPIGFFSSMARERGDFVHFKLGDEAQDIYFVNHPDCIREVLVTHDHRFSKWFAVDRIKEVLGQGLFVSEGEFHTRQRRLVQPAFHRERIAIYAEQMVSLALQLRERWQAHRDIDICAEMNWLALMVVASTLFGADVEADTAQIRAALGEILSQFERSILPEADRIDFDNALARLDAVVYRIIKVRREHKVERNDLLAMLLAAEETTDSMTDLQLRDEAMTIFLAGHETAANGMAWTWYLLGQNPEAEAAFHAELDQVLAGRKPSLADVPQLDVTGRIFAEALRLYPPIWAIGRQALCDLTISGQPISTGSVVILCPYVTQRDPRWFAQPDRFDPNRWTDEARAGRPRFSYFPFSAGRRSCLGETFAEIEAVLSLATIGQKWQLRLRPNQKIALQPQLTLRARNGIKMEVQPRS